jgi:hypothetical protein
MPYPLRLRVVPVVAVVLALGWRCAGVAEAGVVVISNRTAAKVEFSVVRADGKSRQYNLQPGDLVPIPATGKAAMSLGSNETPRRYLMEVNSVYYFLSRNQKLDFVKVAFSTPSERGDPLPTAPDVLIESVGTIPVMILVDDDEPAARQVWEKRLRDRLSEASDVFERHCRIRFEPVAVGTWVSDNNIGDFEKSLREFESKVTPAPARLAIGFTSQYQLVRGETHLGGTRGALGSHVLIREWGPHISKTERLEVLLHELGHFLGATHSPEGNSAMRPSIGDRRSNARDFRIGFDPPNTLVMNLVCEELRTRQVRSLAQLSPRTKARVRDVYASLSAIMPKDPAGKHLTELLDRSPLTLRAPTRHPASLVEATQVVVQAIAAAARENRPRNAGGTRRPLSGDRLMELYVRRAAAAAGRLPSSRRGIADVSADGQAAKAFLLALGITLDRSNVLRRSPIVSDLCRQVESNQELRERLAVFGIPTMRGRGDLAQHFAVSCTLTALIGPGTAEVTGIVKELNDSRGSSGFSFVDLSADMAGVAFATYVGEGKIPLSRVAESFAAEDYLPEGRELREGISWADFLQQYGSPQDDRFHRQRAAIRQRILALPGYQPASDGRVISSP